MSPPGDEMTKLVPSIRVTALPDTPPRPAWDAMLHPLAISYPCSAGPRPNCSLGVDQSSADLAVHRPLENGHVFVDHPTQREPLFGRPAAVIAIELRNTPDSVDELGFVRADETGNAVFDDLWCRSVRSRDDRRPTGERLDHHHAEWLRPLDRIEKHRRSAEEIHLRVVIHFADVLDVGAEHRLQRRLEVVDLDRLAPFAGDAKRYPRSSRDVGGDVRPLRRIQPSKEERVPP